MHAYVGPPSFPPPVEPAPVGKPSRRRLQGALTVVGVVGFVVMLVAVPAVIYTYTAGSAPAAATPTSVTAAPTTEAPAPTTEAPTPTTEAPAAGNSALDNFVVAAGIESVTPAQQDLLCSLIGVNGAPATEAAFKEGFEKDAGEYAHLSDQVWVGLASRC